MMRSMYLVGLLSVSGVIAANAEDAVPAVTADYEVHVVRPLEGGNAIDTNQVYRFYRDGQNRTRLEHGRFITITDPVAGKMYVVDTVAKVVQAAAIPPVTRNRRGQVTHVPGFAENDLPGRKVMEGYEADGRVYKATIPAQAIGNREPVEKTVEVWTSADLKLPLTVTISDPVNGLTTQSYKNVQRTPGLDEGLFRTPVGYLVTEQKAVAASQLPVMQ